jgi:uncharacterized transporter YbjL
MESVRLVLVFLHLVGMASLLGGFLAQLSARPRRIVAAMLHGALLQLVTGVALVGVRQSLHGDDAARWPVDNTKWGVKLAVLLAILVLVVANRRRAVAAPGGFWLIGLLTLGNLALAVFWT